MDELIVVSSDILMHRDIIDVPGIKFELLEDPSNILNTSY